MRSHHTPELTTIAFDADDTLWHNESIFRLTEERFAALLGEVMDSEPLMERLLATERRNLKFYGYGIKGFTLSMIETALEITEGKMSGKVLSEILAAGREMLTHPVETLAGVREVLESLSAHYRLLLITKGDLFDQERKLAESGLADFFNAVEIVSEKSASTYKHCFQRHGTGPEHGLMVGNSLKSDVIPALEAGAWGVYIPYEITWGLELAEEPEGQSRYYRLKSISELPSMLSAPSTFKVGVRPEIHQF